MRVFVLASLNSTSHCKVADKWRAESDGDILKLKILVNCYVTENDDPYEVCPPSYQF